MAVLSAAVILLSAIVMVNLAVTVALIKRLRTESLSAAGSDSRSTGRGLPDVGGLPIGAPVPGELAGRRTLVSFFATSCPGCSALAPRFAAETAKMGADIDVLTVLETTPGADAASLTEHLSRAGRLVVESRPGPLMQAFEAKVTPSFFLVAEDGRLQGKGLTLEECVPSLAAAAHG